jgi:hypothetical protein
MRKFYTFTLVKIRCFIEIFVILFVLVYNLKKKPKNYGNISFSCLKTKKT